MSDEVNIAVEEVNPLVSNGEPGTAIDQSSPLPRIYDGSLEAERAQAIGIERMSIVDAEIPVAITSFSSRRTRSSQRNSHNVRQVSVPAGGGVFG
jgi:hypothetical protein